MAAPPSHPGGRRILATHRRARHEYHVLETVECGLELKGTEVKSLRDGHVSMAESFADAEGGELFVRGMRIEPYAHGNQFNHDPLRPKKLLLHRREIDRLMGQVATKGSTLIPLQLYLKRGRVKLELGLCKGKDVRDKRETLKRRTADREARRAISEHVKR
jgi:SsrA-binding protein